MEKQQSIREKARQILVSFGFASNDAERRKLSREELHRELHIVAKARDEEYERICEIYERTYNWQPDKHEALMMAFDYLLSEEKRRLAELERNRRPVHESKLSAITARKLRGIAS